MNDTKTPLRQPANFDQLYPGRFLKAGLLNGKKVTLTITGATLEELEGEDGKKKKAIIAFRETDLSLVACKTNGLCIREMFGPILSAWVGRKVTIFPGEWNGEPCIRVWGSPELEADRKVKIALPRRKPFDMVLHSVGRAETAPAPQAPPPPLVDELAELESALPPA